MGKRTRTTLSIDAEILERAHQQGVNISRFLEDALRSYLQSGSQQDNGTQQQPQPQPLEQPKELEAVERRRCNDGELNDLKNLFPREALEKLKAYGFDVNDSEWLRRVIYDSLEKCIVILGFEVWDKNSGRYVLLE